MTLTLTLPPGLEQRLEEESKRQHVSPTEYALHVLEQHLSPLDRQTQLIALIQNWIDDDDVAEQKSTGDYLIQVLDEDRLSDRKLFPKELEGVT